MTSFSRSARRLSALARAVRARVMRAPVALHFETCVRDQVPPRVVFAPLETFVRDSSAMRSHI
eukprot:13857700-Alexandrium_andersonii.AAC.1